MRESVYQAQLMRKLRRMFRGCVILKNDTDYQQGIPDLLLLWEGRWAMLEVKAFENAPEQPNQDFYIRKFNGMSFASFIYPENERAVLRDLQQEFSIRREARVP